MPLQMWAALSQATVQQVGPENMITSPGQLPNGSFVSLCTFGSPGREGVGTHIQEPRESHSLISYFCAWLVSSACSRLCLAVSSAFCILLLHL